MAASGTFVGGGSQPKKQTTTKTPITAGDQWKKVNSPGGATAGPITAGDQWKKVNSPGGATAGPITAGPYSPKAPITAGPYSPKAPSGPTKDTGGGGAMVDKPLVTKAKTPLTAGDQWKKKVNKTVDVLRRPLGV